MSLLYKLTGFDQTINITVFQPEFSDCDESYRRYYCPFLVGRHSHADNDVQCGFVDKEIK